MKWGSKENSMSKGYWVVRANVNDADEYSTFTWTTGCCNPDGNSLTGSFQKTNDPNNTNIKDNTHENAGRLILNSVINIIYLMV